MVVIKGRPTDLEPDGEMVCAPEGGPEIPAGRRLLLCGRFGMPAPPWLAPYGPADEGPAPASASLSLLAKLAVESAVGDVGRGKRDC